MIRVARLARPEAVAAALSIVVAMLTATLPVTAVASSKLFKCLIDKRTVYQQQACPNDADPEEAKASAPAAKASDVVASKAAPVRPASRAASAEPAKPR